MDIFAKRVALDACSWLDPHQLIEFTGPGYLAGCIVKTPNPKVRAFHSEFESLGIAQEVIF